jgi:hypothetical protein
VDISLIGNRAGEARDVVRRALGDASSIRLVVVADGDAGGDAEETIRARMADGALLYVDDWTGDPERLLRFVQGGALRELRADEPPLAGPTRLAAVPEAHSGVHAAGDARIVGVEAGGRMRVVATVQDTLCHGCSCDALPGRRAFAQNLVAFAKSLSAHLRPASPPVAVSRAALGGGRLRVAADFHAPTTARASARLELLALTGGVLAEKRAELAAGASLALDLDVGLAAPFEVLDHRVVATITTADAVLRDVRPLIGLVGAADLRVVGSDTLRAGGPGTVRVLLRNSLRGDAIAGAALSLTLSDEKGGLIAGVEGVSDSAGTASLVINVPIHAPAKARLMVEARSALATDRVETDVAITSRLAAQVLCDLPIHRPGDELGARALVVEQPSGRPAASRKVQFELKRDGSVVGERASAETDAFGVATATLRVPQDVGPSDCRVELVEGRRTIASAPVRIERFETPTFQVTLSPSTPQATPGRTLPVTVACARFDGRPLADAAVRIELRPASGGSSLVSWEGRTDAQGSTTAPIAVPARGTGARARAEELLLVAVVRDAGGREVRTHVKLGAADASDASAEFDVLAPDGPLASGGSGRVLVHAAREPGATLDVTVGARPARQVVLDQFGLAEIRVEDARVGESVSIGGARRDLPVADAAASLVVDRRVVAACGEVGFRFAAVGPADVAFVDLLRDDVVVSTQTIAMSGRAGAGVLRIPEGVVGPVVVHAYVIGAPDDDRPALLADARALLVVPREDLRATATPSRTDVAPGETLDLVVNVSDAAGRGAPAVVAVRVADQAVLSLAAADPESARMVLALDERVSRASRRIGGLSAAGVASLAARRPLSESEQRVADALFAALDRAVRYDLDAVTLPARFAAYPKRVEERLRAYWAETIPALRAALVGPLSPAPGETTRDVVAALRAAESLGAFGDAGLVDPWGSPLALETDDGRVRASSVGPDAVSNTDDDSVEWLDADATRKLHVDWLAAHDVVIDDAAFRSAYVSRRVGAGGGGGGAMGMGRGGASAFAGRRTSDEPTRMRRFFPAALLWAPAHRTDDDGRAVLTLRAPDSLTTWRVDVVASDRRGNAADASAQFTTSQPFAVDADVPPAMLVGDEIEIPVVLRCSRPVGPSASVAAEVSREGSLVSPAKFDVPLSVDRETTGRVRVRAVKPGALKIRLRADAGERGDAVERVVVVAPAGRDVVHSAPVVLNAAGASVRTTIDRPARAMSGADRAELRIAASPIAAALDGVEGMLRKPHGCFEQTSSALYPDVLALLYLNRGGKASPDVETRFRAAIDDGVARLLSFEIEGGGFDWFGRPPAKPLLTAYGLHEWTDIAELTPSKRDVARRTAKWLASIQREDGSFPLDDAPYGWVKEAKGATAATAYVTWALARCGSEKESVARAADWLRPRLASEADPYALALAVAALAEIDAADVDALAAAARLASMARREDGAMRFEAPAGSALHGRRAAAGVESTAVAALAAIRLARADVLPAEPLLRALVRARGADGTWGTTQATVLALRAQLAVPVDAASPATLTLRGGGRDRVVELRPEDRDVVKVVDVADLLDAKARPAFEASCAGADLSATFVLRSVVPFDAPPASASPLRFTSTPDRASCKAGDVVTLSLRLETTDESPAAMPLVEIPLGAGFVADGASLDALRRAPGVERVEADARVVVVYLRSLERGAPFTATIDVRPRLRGRITAPPASACPYYEPDARVHAKAATFTVE